MKGSLNPFLFIAFHLSCLPENMPNIPKTAKMKVPIE